MKKLFSVLLLYAMIGFVFTGCSKDDDESISKDKIIGTWDAKQVKVDGDWITIPYNSRFSLTMTFYRDGTYYGSSKIFGTGYGTYKVIGNSIKTYTNGEYLYTYRINSITDTKAEVIMIDEESSSGSSLNLRLNKR